MPVPPIVRYLLPCKDCVIDAQRELRVAILGLISNLVAVDDPPYPVRLRELCMFVALTEGRGQGEVKIACVYEENGETVFESRSHQLQFGADPLDVTMYLFRINDCPFPFPGMYQVQFWYNDAMLEQSPIRLR